jgi:hypothetical protein
MSSSSVVVLKRTEVEPAYEWYVKRTTLVRKIRRGGLSRETAQGVI